MTFRWTDDSLFDAVGGADREIQAMIGAVFEYRRGRVTSYAKENAPWTDRTGNARQGLNTVYERSDSEHSLILSHRMPYGIFLEARTRHQRRSYAIIMPTVRVQGRELMKDLNGLMNRLKGRR